MKYQFPQNFYWGASTSAHQVEGNNTNTWSKWEQEVKFDLATKGLEGVVSENALLGLGKEPAAVFKEQSHNPENYISGMAANHYNMFAEDFELAKQMGHNAHRLSVEWSRIEPEEGRFNYAEVEHYKRVFECMRNDGIQPFVTLWHWPIPLWMQKYGGWESNRIIDKFTNYAQFFVEQTKDLVHFWITLNEPLVYTALSYYTGDWPPQKKSLFASINVAHKLIAAHNRSYNAIKSIDSNFKVGIAHNVVYYEPYQNKPWNRLVKYGADWVNYKYILDRINRHQDFIGINHYFRNRIDGVPNKNPDTVTSDLGWDLCPEAIYPVLMDVHKRYKKPMYITENGLADAFDRHRSWYIKEILKNVHKAIQDGANVKGYLHWSFLDNFEWSKGFWPRFGLVHVDYKDNFKRTPRQSALMYADIIKNNGFDD